MKFKLVRIDDRLIHGQVALGWSRAKGIDTILAVDDVVAKDKFQCSLLKMATPPGVQSFILTADEAEQKVKDGTLEKKKVMLLVKGPETLLKLVEKGFEISEVNIGNMRSVGGKTKLLNYVYASDSEISFLKAISAKGIKMYGQAVPDQSGVDFNEILEKI